MIPVSAYRKLFRDAGGVIGYIPVKGNVGDELIEFATLALMRKWRIPHEVLCPTRLRDDCPQHITRLYISGGGNMGDVYTEHMEIRHLACSKGRPVVVLPRSFINSNEDLDPYESVWVREKQSLKICPEARLAPDMTMYLDLDPRTKDARYLLGVFLRKDQQGLFIDHSASYGDPVKLAGNIAAFLDLIAPYKHIVTDRLQFAIAAMLMSRSVTLLPGKSFENRSMWETWLSKYRCRWQDHPDQVPGVRTRRAVKKVSPAKSLRLNNQCVIHRAPGWARSGTKLLHKHEEKKKDCYIENLSTLERAVWILLSRPKRLSELKSGLREHLKIDRRVFDKVLNRGLRRLFSLGAIEISLGSQVAVGGRYGVPIEVNLFDPVRLGEDIYLFANIRRRNKVSSFWYRICRDDQEHLSDAGEPFLLAFLFASMRYGRPLWLRNGSVSAELLANLSQYQKVWSTWQKQIHEVAIIASTRIERRRVRKTDSRSAIACFSGGVDSTFTLYNHTINGGNPSKLPLTHALLVHGFDIAIADQASFDHVKAEAEKVTADVGVELLTVATNIRNLKMLDWKKSHGALMSSALHLLSKQFRYGLIPSTLNYRILYPWGSTPLTDPMLSSGSLMVISVGADYTRVKKIRSIKPWKTGISKLRFCPVAYPATYNCGKCGKCTLTAAMIRLCRASKASISPFPGDRRIAMQLHGHRITRLDRSDFRNEIEGLKKMRPKPNWAHLLVKKLKRN